MATDVGGGRALSCRAPATKNWPAFRVVDALARAGADSRLSLTWFAREQSCGRLRRRGRLVVAGRLGDHVFVTTSIPAPRVVRVLDQLVALYGRPQALRLDNGPEATAQVFVDWCDRHGIARLYIQPGNPVQNAFIERFNQTYREEVLDAYLFVSTPTR